MVWRPALQLPLIAIVLDRLTQAWAVRNPAPSVTPAPNFFQRHRNFSLALLVLVITTLIGFVSPFFAQWPRAVRSHHWTVLERLDQVDQYQLFRRT